MIAARLHNDGCQILAVCVHYTVKSLFVSMRKGDRRSLNSSAPPTGQVLAKDVLLKHPLLLNSPPNTKSCHPW